MCYTTFVFDFDYTLADATVGIVDSANYALDKLGLERKDRGSIRKTVGMTLRETFSVLTNSLRINLWFISGKWPTGS